MKLYFFESGKLFCEKSKLTLNQGVGKIVESPIGFFVIQHPKGTVLFDTGLPLECLNTPEMIIPEAYSVEFTQEQYVTERLKTIGLTPEDITHLVLSHMHWDHAGGIREFPNVAIYVSSNEVEPLKALAQGEIEEYRRQILDSQENLHYVDDSRPMDLFGDGSVVIYSTKGHTMGHQSLMVNLPETGAVFLAQDAIYTEEILSKEALPAVAADMDIAAKTVEVIRTLKDAGTKIVCGHDQKSWAPWKMAPAYYE